MGTKVRPPCPPPVDSDPALRELLLASDRLTTLTSTWYPDEYHYITAEIFTALLGECFETPVYCGH
ncbi:hypothetical protein [Anaeroselena agilis]|uniref:Uncharacterized protein n=1 Tax=Anaeroselena agilis TaxID=3063788 RepID=A0ABU3NVD5_9FIRM|nr:hypothetical protein [Selenomonadales bacterium 4137-cl]